MRGQGGLYQASGPALDIRAMNEQIIDILDRLALALNECGEPMDGHVWEALDEWERLRPTVTDRPRMSSCPQCDAWEASKICP
jgi:hypothetical protein